MIGLYGAFLLVVTGGWPFASKTDPLQELQAIAQAKYPASEHIWAIGESGNGVEEAETRARAKVAEQIEHSIQSTFLSLTKESRGIQDASFSSVTEWQTRKESRFEGAEQIRTDSPRRDGGRWLVLAHLSRRQAVENLILRYEDSARRFRSHAQQALEASSLESFTASWNPALGTSRWLKLQGVRFLSLAGLPYNTRNMGEGHPHAPAFPQDMALVARLDSVRLAKLSKQRVAVKVVDLPGYQPRAIQVLKREGLAVVPDKADWELSLRWSKEESESAIGEIMRCKLVPELILISASGARIESKPIASASGEGFRLYDPKAACEEARAKVDQESLDSALKNLLPVVFPLSSTVL